jgi:sterol desaturase/sphingolipid hydroxylase (fatty acid hydroxylase superfamily)
MWVLSAAAIRGPERPVTRRLTALVERRRWGLVKQLGLPRWAEVAAAVGLLDYTLFIWHVLTHRVPFLWRFHEVHHADRDLSTTTALRFHLVEMVLSVPWRAAQVACVGAAPLSLSVWQTTTLVAILFHHANVALPIQLERRLCRLVMTPRMHGIHHSIVRDETDANWSTILSWPDYLHRTVRLDVPQRAVEIGAPTVRGDAVRALPDLIARPFVSAARAPMIASRGDLRPGVPATDLVA